MRSIIKYAVPAVALSLTLAACGTTGGDTAGTGSTGGGAACDLKLAFFGALTGDAAALGQNIKNGVDLAIEEYNAKNADCKVTVEPFDSQGDPAQAPALANSIVADKKFVGVIGPAFSGESKAANPIFEAAGVALITPSATNPDLAKNGWKVFHRILGNDAQQGPAAAKYINDNLKAEKVFVADDSSEYGKGLADIVRTELGAKVVDNDSVQQKQTDFSATVTKIKASGATALFYGGYYAEAAILAKQLRAAGSDVTIVVGDGVKDDAYVKQAGDAGEGTVMICPCVPAEASSAAFQDAYTKKFNSPPATYSGEGYDATNVFLAAIAAGKTSLADINAAVSAFEGEGASKPIKWDETGELAVVSIWSYKVEGGKIVTDVEIPL